MSRERKSRPVPAPAESLREYGRGLAGGLLFSLPLLYTMEVWWSGFIASPARILIYLLAVFVLLLGYNRYAGIRYDASWAEIAIDSVEELGLGVLTSAGVLYLIGQIGSHVSFLEGTGKTLVEAGIVAIGFSVGTAQLGGDSDDEGAPGNEGRSSGVAPNVVIAACGAALLAANVAPTEEILMIAVETSPPKLLGLVIISTLVAMLILYHSDFTNARHARAETRWDIAAGTVVTYAIALLMAAAMLWFFGRFQGMTVDVCVRQIVVLAFPAVLGASAGRLLLQR